MVGVCVGEALDASADDEGGDVGGRGSAGGGGGGGGRHVGVKSSERWSACEGWSTGFL